MVHGLLTEVASLVAEHRLQSVQPSVVVAPRFSITGSIVVVHRLSCPVARGIFPVRDRTHISCIGRWILYHLSHQGSLKYILERENTAFVTYLKSKISKYRKKEAW